jgi:hypothetical protein
MSQYTTLARLLTRTLHNKLCLCAHLPVSVPSSQSLRSYQPQLLLHCGRRAQPQLQSETAEHALHIRRLRRGGGGYSWPPTAESLARRHLLEGIVEK